MSDQTQVPPQLPPIVETKAFDSTFDSRATMLGSTPEEQQPISSVAGTFEALLREQRRVMFQLRQRSAGRLIGALVALAIVSSLVYGLVVGAFSGGAQLWAAPLKIAAGLLVSALICLPSLYIFSCLSGSRARLLEVGGLVAGLLALITVLLIGFAPVAWVFSQSTQSQVAMGSLHLVFFAIALGFGLRFLVNGFAHLEAKSNAGLNVWILIFLLVTLQMSTALRPLVGTADTLLPTEKKFFVTHWFDSLKEGERSRAER